jgi:hypothetical protein
MKPEELRSENPQYVGIVLLEYKKRLLRRLHKRPHKRPRFNKENAGVYHRVDVEQVGHLLDKFPDQYRDPRFVQLYENLRFGKNVRKYFPDQSSAILYLVEKTEVIFKGTRQGSIYCVIDFETDALEPTKLFELYPDSKQFVWAGDRSMTIDNAMKINSVIHDMGLLLPMHARLESSCGGE